MSTGNPSPATRCSPGVVNLEAKLSVMQTEMKSLQKELFDVRKVKNLDKNSNLCRCPGVPAGSSAAIRDFQAEQDRAELERLREMNRELREEIEDAKSHSEDMQAQMDDYRNKYLEAQEVVEEQRRQIDALEQDNGVISDQVSQELQRVKKLFREKLEELAPLPYILETTQIKCQESMQEKVLLEKSVESLTLDLAAARQKEKDYAMEIECAQNVRNQLEGSNETLKMQLQTYEEKYADLLAEHTTIQHNYEVALQTQQELEIKVHEMTQVASQLENFREESARQVQRMKERNENQRKMLQDRLATIEVDLAQSRAAARAAIRDKDEIKHRLQVQIDTLTERFEEAQVEIENLKDHVNVLKSTYSSMIEGSDGPNDFLQCNCQRNI